MSFLRGYAKKLGVLEYLGTWDASTNNPPLVSSAGQRGGYYIVNIAGTTELDGISDWGISDWVIFNGTNWEKIDNSEEGYTKTETDQLIEQVKDRAYHTGVQLSETIVDFADNVNNSLSSLFGDSEDIQFIYPDENGKAQASLKNTGVVPGFYNKVLIDSKGRILSALNTVTDATKFTYITDSIHSTTLTSFINIPQLTSISLSAGLYKFEFYSLAQSTSTTTGIGVRLIQNSAIVSTIYGKYSISQAVPGTVQSYEYDQISQNSNVTSTNVVSTSFGFVIRGEGIVRIINPGSLSMQFRSEVDGSAVSIGIDSIFSLEKL